MPKENFMSSKCSGCWLGGYFGLDGQAEAVVLGKVSGFQVSKTLLITGIC
jgi:hypothetical protein